MTNEKVGKLRRLRVLLKSGDYTGTDIMEAWIALDEYADLLEHQPVEPEDDGLCWIKGCQRRRGHTGYCHEAEPENRSVTTEEKS